MVEHSCKFLYYLSKLVVVVEDMMELIGIHENYNL